MAKSRLCSVAVCAKEVLSRGLCNKHYTRLKRWGTTDGPESPEDVFWSRVDKSQGPEGCWLWKLKLDDRGYGRHHVKGIPTPFAHRHSYLMAYGFLPPEVDHQCRVRHCVNPKHLKDASHKVNMENQNLSARNSSGYRGVSWNKEARKWRAYVRHHGNLIYLGDFLEVEDANRAAIAGRAKYFENNVSDASYGMESTA